MRLLPAEQFLFRLLVSVLTMIQMLQEVAEGATDVLEDSSRFRWVLVAS